jgi:hypothetical protein
MLGNASMITVMSAPACGTTKEIRTNASKILSRIGAPPFRTSCNGNALVCNLQGKRSSCKPMCAVAFSASGHWGQTEASALRVSERQPQARATWPYSGMHGVAAGPFGASQARLTVGAHAAICARGGLRRLPGVSRGASGPFAHILGLAAGVLGALHYEPRSRESATPIACAALQWSPQWCTN